MQTTLVIIGIITVVLILIGFAGSIAYEERKIKWRKKILKDYDERIKVEERKRTSKISALAD